MNTDTKFIKDKIKEFKLFPKKKLGQHFLINPNITQKIILTVKDLKPSQIIEVGPGWGALTNPLMQLKKPLQVIEVDHTLAQYWQNKGVFVIKTSALKINWHHQAGGHNPQGEFHLPHEQSPQGEFRLPHEQSPQDEFRLPHEQSLPCEQNLPNEDKIAPPIKKGTVLVGNLPFNIGSRLLVQLCPGPPALKAMVFMFQKEVAQRILSPHKCKSYGILSVLSQCFWDVKPLLSVGRTNFYPRPQVAGQVLIFRPKNHRVLNPKHFLSFVKFCFAQRRKTLFTRLCRSYLNQTGRKPTGTGQARSSGRVESSGQAESAPQVSPAPQVEQHLIDLFDKLNIGRLARAEALSPPQFEKLFNALQNKNQKRPKKWAKKPGFSPLDKL